MAKKSQFRKALAVYYIRWFQDCHKSAIYCHERMNQTEYADGKLEREYLDGASNYLTIIMENWDVIEFFSKGHNAFMIDSYLPEQFRGYE